MIRLPRSLLEEIGSSAPTHTGNRRAVLLHLQLAKSPNPGRPKSRLPRKGNRKLERVESKKRKAEHHANKQHQQHKRPPFQEHEDAPVAKKNRVSAPPPKVKTSNPKPKRKTPLQRLADNSSGYGGPLSTQGEDKEDAYIHYLEGKLGWKKNGMKTSAYGSGLADDGLGGLYMSFSVVSTSLTEYSICRTIRRLGYLRITSGAWRTR